MILQNEHGPLPVGADYDYQDNVVAYASLLAMTDEERAAWGVTVGPEPEPAPLTVEQCLAALADLRWRKTQTMPAYDGASDVPADTARSVITSKVVAAQFLSETEQLQPHAFKLKPGEWRDWAIPDLVAYGLAIGVYMQACFDHEATLEDAIRASEDPASIDIMAGWPE